MKKSWTGYFNLSEKSSSGPLIKTRRLSGAQLLGGPMEAPIIINKDMCVYTKITPWISAELGQRMACRILVADARNVCTFYNVMLTEYN